VLIEVLFSCDVADVRSRHLPADPRIPSSPSPDKMHTSISSIANPAMTSSEQAAGSRPSRRTVATSVGSLRSRRWLAAVRAGCPPSRAGSDRR
jgi:hypothetical protein